MKILRLGCLILLLLLLFGCGKREFFRISKDPIFETENVEVIIPGLETTYTFLYFSDLHIVVNDEYVNQNDKDMIAGRLGWSSGRNGKTAAENWLEYSMEINRMKPDAVLFGGDMVDYCTPSTTQILSEGLEAIEVPWMYVRADHDNGPHWCDKNVNKELCEDLQNGIDENTEMMEMEFPEFIIVGWNNSTAQMTEEQLIEFKRIMGKNKPIILLTHVPIESQVDQSLNKLSKENWGDRALLWGDGCLYQPNAVTSEFLEILKREDGPVKEVLCGHLHCSWDGMLTRQMHQHVFSPAMYGYCGKIIVSGGRK